MSAVPGVGFEPTLKAVRTETVAVLRLLVASAASGTRGAGGVEPPDAHLSELHRARETSLGVVHALAKQLCVAYLGVEHRLALLCVAAMVVEVGLA
jgi:hypothetical protein